MRISFTRGYAYKAKIAKIHIEIKNVVCYNDSQLEDCSGKELFPERMMPVSMVSKLVSRTLGLDED